MVASMHPPVGAGYEVLSKIASRQSFMAVGMFDASISAVQMVPSDAIRSPTRLTPSSVGSEIRAEL
jgi:hypothetical protein